MTCSLPFDSIQRNDCLQNNLQPIKISTQSNYAEEVYRAAGYGLNDILFNIVITGTVCLVVNCVAIGTVDRFGRHILMLIGCAGIGLCHTFLGTCYMLGIKGMPVLAITLTAIGLYSMSLAPIAWVLISGIFPNRIRARRSLSPRRPFGSPVLP